MNMGKILSVLVAIFIFVSANGQEQSFNEQVYSCYIQGDMDRWEVVMDEMEDVWQRTKSYDLLFDYTIAQYGYIAFCLAREKKDMAGEIIKIAIRNVQLMLKQDPDWARAHALLGGLYGLKVGLNPLKNISYTNKSFDETKIAKPLDPNDAHVWMEKGNFELYKPSVFGGNKKDAIRHFKKSVALFENNKSELKFNWLYLNTLNGLAKAYIKTGNLKHADLTYKKIIRVEPKLTWIRDRDYPRFLEKYGKQVD
jgi:tetratricopeptide (TPR) repeat protein